MERLPKTFVLLFALAIPAAAPPVLQAPGACFTLGSTTYQLAAAASAPDYRVRFERTSLRPDLQFRSVERAEMADFVLVDDDNARHGDACKSAGAFKTINIVAEDGPANLTVGLAHDNDDADFTVFVRSSRVSTENAAALFAVMRATQTAGKLVAAR